MNRIHFIAIGGAAMHNLAIELANKGFEITGSDDEIFDPSLSRLKMHNLLPSSWGWDPSRINDSIDSVILGMHAQKNNPELLRALDLGIKVYSYPEFLYEQVKDKMRIVIAGSHGKTTITAMIIHVLKRCGITFDFMVGSQIEGFDNMVSLNKESKIAVFEGDEYLSSALDPHPKFLHYKPHIALISGIAWDHVNVFPSFPEYVEQFQNLLKIIQPHGHLIYYANDPVLESIVTVSENEFTQQAYIEHKSEVLHEITYLITPDNQKVKINVFGKHNLQNISGARLVCHLAGVTDKEFYEAISDFSGAARRLQEFKRTEDSIIFYDFAHSPSKVKATVKAVKEQFPYKTLIAILELHTYSSLNEKFIPEYFGTLNEADKAIIYFNPKVIKSKGLKGLKTIDIKKYFNLKSMEVFTDPKDLEQRIRAIPLSQTILLFMSSGNFGGISLKKLFH